MTVVEPPSARNTIDRRFVIVFALVSLIPLGLIVLAIAPGLRPVRAIHLHAPELWRIAAAPPAVQVHLAGIGVAIAVGVVLMLGVKGSLMHRVLGWTWVVAMMTGAVSSLFIRMLNHGAFSYIHLISGWTIIALPMALAAARSRRVKLHARLMTGLFTGGLVLAGVLAFLPGRLMWEMIFS